MVVSKWNLVYENCNIVHDVNHGSWFVSLQSHHLLLRRGFKLQSHLVGNTLELLYLYVVNYFSIRQLFHLLHYITRRSENWDLTKEKDFVQISVRK